MVIKMMKTKILQIIVLMFLINIVFVRAAIDASYECKEKNCIEGTEVFFTVNVIIIGGRRNIDQNLTGPSTIESRINAS